MSLKDYEGQNNNFYSIQKFVKPRAPAMGYPIHENAFRARTTLHTAPINYQWTSF